MLLNRHQELRGIEQKEPRKATKAEDLKKATTPRKTTAKKAKK
ncbi:MAG: hypothetical protein E6672_07130 [Negativicoccus succinicivorans]|nr:hypothetical protein [Negativicoccus succinicivorans]